MDIIFVSAFTSGKIERVIMVDVRMSRKSVIGLIFLSKGFAKCFSLVVRI